MEPGSSCSLNSKLESTLNGIERNFSNSTCNNFDKKASLNLAVIGNCACSALIDKRGQIVWYCLPRFDGDPIFCSLLKNNVGLSSDIGFFDVTISQMKYTEQSYIGNSPVLKTKLFDENGGGLEIIDFIPRFQSFERDYRPNMLIRIVKPISNRPRAQIQLRPTFGYGWGSPEKTRGSNHIRYVLSNLTIRLTTNAPISYVVDEVTFEVEETLYFVLMPDESLRESLDELCISNLNKTLNYWHDWTKTLTIPFEWQDEVLRAAITLKLSQYEETGAFVASMTTSVPNSRTTPSYDARYCWPRDALWVTYGLNQLGATKVMEQYLKYISNILAIFCENKERNRKINPIYSVSMETRLYERVIHRLPGYRGIGTVQIGNRDCETIQHDVYGSIILGLTHTFFDRRIQCSGSHVLFSKLEILGHETLAIYNKPDDMIRSRIQLTSKTHYSKVHTFSAVMCWAACNRLAKIAEKLELNEKKDFWENSSQKIKNDILQNCWNSEIESFVNQFGGNEVDAYLLILPRLGFISVKDPKFIGTLNRIEKVLKRKNWIRCYEEDDFAVVGATLEYVLILSEVGRKEEARRLFEFILSNLNPSGMIGEAVDYETNEHWGNFPNSNAMVGIISVANKLSKQWELAM